MILCSGVQAEQPFYFDLTGTRIYSIEELCYYLYHNIYTITEDLFDQNLVNWLSEQIHMETIAVKLQSMLENQNSMKDLVVSILCSADYYKESEIKALIKVMDEINHRTPKDRQIIKADNLLKYNNYDKAAKEYEILLKGEYGKLLTTEEYGNILHNIAVSHIHTASYEEAIMEFKEAYSRNHRSESLKQYFFAMKMGKMEELYENELLHFQISQEQEESFEQEFKSVWGKAEECQEYMTVNQIPEIKKDGRVNEYYQKIEETISIWKQNYKKEIG